MPNVHAAYIPAVELIGLLAYGDRDGWRRLSAHDIYARWQMIPDIGPHADREDGDLVMLLRAMTGSDPSAAERWTTLASTSPKYAERKTWLVATLQERRQTPEEALESLRSDIARFATVAADHDARIAQASTAIRNAIASGRLEAWGKVGNNTGRTEPEGDLERIPAEHAHPDTRELVLDTNEPRDPIAWLISRRRRPMANGDVPPPQWCRVQFKTEEALKWLSEVMRVSPSGAAIDETPISNSAPKGRKFTGLDYSEQDRPLVEEMMAMIDAGTARSPEDAASAVVGRAAGHGAVQSKVIRLARRFRKVYRTKS